MIFFQNNGHFDIRAMVTMGLSVKSENAIGFFGTGFKYAVAVILRGGGNITIETTDGVYQFTKRLEEFRGSHQEFVYLNDQPAGFTTHMGVQWEPWMAYRELYSNCLDEGGLISTQYATGYDTTIRVEWPEFDDLHEMRGKYFLTSTPLVVGDEAEIHPKNPAGGNAVYYKTVAVAEPDRSFKYTYNILRDLTLTEERLVRYDSSYTELIVKTLLHASEDIIRDAFSRGEHKEAELHIPTWMTIPEKTVEIFTDMARKGHACESVIYVLEHVKNKNGNWEEFELNSVEQKMFDKAVSFLAKIDIPVKEYPIRTVVSLGSGVMGRAHKGYIYVSKLAFNMGTKQVASTLLEEWVHLHTGAEDFDREMQNWLFDRILSMGEIIQNEPI